MRTHFHRRSTVALNAEKMLMLSMTERLQSTHYITADGVWSGVALD